MPRPLRWAAYSGAIWGNIFAVIVLAFVMAQAVSHGEVGFSRDDRYWLEKNYPGGIYVSQHSYKWCDGRTWQHYDRANEGVFNNFTIAGEMNCAARPREAQP